MMNIMIIGSGGREHALAWKTSLSPLVNKVFVCPGNHGMEQEPKISTLRPSSNDHHALLDLIIEHHIDFVIIGPEKPLVDGLSDFLRSQHIDVLGPSMFASKLEGSKIFAKHFMMEHLIPTAHFKSYHSPLRAIDDLSKWDLDKGIVIKADGLAAGKGVVVTHNYDEAVKTVTNFMENPLCSVKSDQILIEEKVTGQEVSAFALCDGDTFIPLGFACDYKRLLDGNLGPNTGGMGCYTPEEWPDANTKEFIYKHVFKKVVDGMKSMGTPFQGILFAGLMINKNNLNVLEFNVRFGDPETQVLLPTIEEDIVPLLLASTKGNLNSLGLNINFNNQQKAVHVVMASQGYPNIDQMPLLLKQPIQIKDSIDKAKVFYSAVEFSEDGTMFNNGGRVLGVTAVAPSIAQARERAYTEIKKISFNQAHWRTDIGL